MRVAARMRLAAVAGALWVGILGCGGPAPAVNDGCRITLSGAFGGTYACTAASAGWSSSSDTGLVGTSVSGMPAIVVSISFPGEPRAGTFHNTDAGAKGG